MFLKQATHYFICISVLNYTLEALLCDSPFVNGRDLIHKAFHLVLQLLGGMSLMDELQYLSLQWSRQLQVQHSRIG